MDTVTVFPHPPDAVAGHKMNIWVLTGKALTALSKVAPLVVVGTMLLFQMTSVIESLSALRVETATMAKVCARAKMVSRVVLVSVFPVRTAAQVTELACLSSPLHTTSTWYTT